MPTLRLQLTRFQLVDKEYVRINKEGQTLLWGLPFLFIKFCIK